jgi:hypothetical protein
MWMDRAERNGGNPISFGRVVLNTFSKLRRLQDRSAANLDSTDFQPPLANPTNLKGRTSPGRKGK